ncbi:MAG: phytanoyl-CoA dioxygenase family protein [Planctomycetaceae bacterium]
MPTIDTESYRERGYLRLRNFVDRSAIDEIRNDARRVFEFQMQARGISARADAEATESEFEQELFEFFRRDVAGFANCGKQIQHLISLHRLSLDARIQNVLRDLGLQFPNISTRPVMFFNSRHLATKEVYWRVFAHQDWRSMQGSLNAVVVWLPLGNIDRNLGALEIVPGSHRLGLVTTEIIERFGKVDGFQETDFEAVEVEKGDALFFSAFLVHRSGTNSTEAIRWSCHFRYNDLAESTFISRGYPHPYLYQPVEELLTPGFPAREEVERIFAADRDPGKMPRRMNPLRLSSVQECRE